MEPIHHLLCTHCTVGSSALENVAAEEPAGRRVLGYSVRSSSIVSRDTLREEFRAVERLLTYHLPLDATAEDRQAFNANTAPKRLVFFPDVAGRTVLAHVVYRPFDTAGRPGSYFAHVLVTTQPTAWSALAALRVWDVVDPAGASGWCLEDREDFDSLRPLGSLAEWGSSSLSWVSDAAAAAFINDGTGGGDPSGKSRLQSRWRQDVEPSVRERLLETMIQAMLSKAAGTAVIFCGEPATAAVLFYAAIRLLPKHLQSGASFSTFEPDPSRSSARLMATTFVGRHPDLPAQYYEGDTYVCNTLHSPFREGRWRPVPGRYARWAVRMLKEGKVARVERLGVEIQQAWACVPGSLPSADDLDRVCELADLCEQMLAGAAAEPPRDLATPLKRFVAARFVNLVRKYHARLSNRQSQKLIPQLLSVSSGFRDPWDRLLQDTAGVEWFCRSVPRTDAAMIFCGDKCRSLVPDPIAVNLFLAYTETNRALPSSLCKRLWGACDAALTGKSDSRAGGLLLEVLQRIDPQVLQRLVPDASPPPLYASAAVLIASALDTDTDVGKAATSRTRRLASHLLRVASDAAESLAADDLFYGFLQEARTAAHWVASGPTPIGKRVAHEIDALARKADCICADVTYLSTMTAWAECTLEPAGAVAQVEAWKKMCSWLGGLCDQSRDETPFRGAWHPTTSREGGALKEQICGIARTMIPDRIEGASELRFVALRTITKSFLERKWMNARTYALLQGLLGDFFPR